MRAVRFLAWSAAARRLASGLVLAALLAVAGGIVLTALAGARRTDSAYTRLRQANLQADIVVAAQGDPTTFDPSVVTGAPGVASFGVIDGFGAIEVVADGTLDTQRIAALLAPADTVAFSVMDRPVIAQGRLPNPDAADEITIDRAASAAGRPTGSTIDLCVLGPDGFGALTSLGGGAAPTAEEQRAFVAESCDVHHLHVVGVTRPGPDEVVIQRTSEQQSFYVGTPALARVIGGEKAFSFVDVDLAEGADTSAFVDGVLDNVSPDAGVTVQTNSLRAAVVARTVEPYVRALSLFGVAAALATLGVLGPALLRWTATPAADRVPLLSVGVRPQQLRLAGALRGALLGTVAAIGAVAAAVAASSRFPIGIAEDIEPNPGTHIDVVVLVPGAVALVVLGLAIGAIASTGSSRAPRRSSRIGDWLQASGAPPSVIAGVRSAFSADGNALPAATGVAVAVVAVVAALTFQSGLGRLLDTPARYGWTWDAVIDGSSGALAPATLDALPDDPNVRSYSLGRRTNLLVGGTAVPTFAFEPVRGAVTPTIVDGRAPRGDAEIALGGQTIDRLGTRVGAPLTLRGPDGTTIDATVVGRTLLPLSNLEQDLSIGEGALVDQPLLDRVGGADPGLALIDLQPGKTVEDLRATLGEQVLGNGAITDVLGPTYTADLRGYDAVRETPLLLAGVLALLGVGVLAHAILVMARRRRRELAMLRCLGFVRRDLQATVRSNALSIVLVCLVVGVPVGVAIGRTLWGGFARAAGVPDDPLTPSLLIAAVAATAIIGALLLSLVPGRQAARLRPAQVLRGE